MSLCTPVAMACGEVRSKLIEAGHSTAAPRLGRQALSEWLARFLPDKVIDDPARSVRLTTNAVMHTSSAATIVASFDEGRLRMR
jgi:hypothetical protein